jgi:undecaprenyl-diphosphatase
MHGLDEAILIAFANWRTPWLNRAVVEITALGSLTVISLTTIISVTLLLTIAGDRLGAAKIVTAAAGGELWLEILKRVFEHPRPTIVPHLVEFSGYSYPSGHALAATVTYGMLAAIACGYVRQPAGRMAIRIVCFTLAGMVAVSRVYLGVHYASDVISGVLLGVVWIYITKYAWQWMR